VRADFEDEMAAQIARAGIETIPGNHILLRPDPKVKLDLDYLRAQIRDNHIDAIVVSRLLNVDKRRIDAKWPGRASEIWTTERFLG
jgi:hypothetical protein